MSKNAERAAETRQRIIHAVLRIIGQDGVSGLTNRRIAKEAGVSLGSVTYHFATQHDLLCESLLHFVAEETRWFTELAERYRADQIGPDQAATAIREVSAGATLEAEEIAPYELYLQAGRDPRLRAAAEESFTAYDRLATTILTALGIRDAERYAPATVALIMGRSLRHLATGQAAVDLADMLLVLSRGTRQPPADASRLKDHPIVG